MSNTEGLGKLDPYTENGTDSGGLDGGPDQPLDDRVGLWCSGSPGVNNPQNGTTQRGHVLLNPVLLRRKKKNKVALKEVMVGSEQVAPFLMVGEVTNVMRTVE